MKIQFSLRSFLIAVAVLGVVLLPVANFLYQVKSQIWRQKLAVARLEDAGSRAQRAALVRPPNEGVRYEGESADWLTQFARDYIDPLAYEPRSEVSLCSMGNQPLEAATCEKLLASVRDLYQVQMLGMSVDQFTEPMFEEIKTLPDLTSLSITADAINSKAMKRLCEFQQLDDLCLEMPMTDELASATAKLQRLSELSLNPSSLSASSASLLGKSLPLKVLWVQRGKLSGGELFSEWGKHGTARSLYLVDCDLDSDATLALSKLTSLEEFYHLFQGCSTSDDLSTALSGMVNLTKLTVRLPAEVPIADQCKNLARLTQLERLELRSPVMTAEGLASLGSLAKLKYLFIYGDLSREEVERFLRSGPKDCKVLQFSRDEKGQVLEQRFELP